MKKILIGFLLSIFIVGCVSNINAKMKSVRDPITGNIIYYGYSWTTGSEDITHDFDKRTDLSTTLIVEPIKDIKKMNFTVIKSKEVKSAVYLQSYTLNIQSIKITNGTEEFIVENPGLTKKEFSSLGTPFGHSTVTFPIRDEDLRKLYNIYNSEKVILMATDIYGKEHLGIVKDKTGILELIEFLK
ncbi:hypothetical protein [uncultured Ilyobacter sp.]|uniref:hypothetical protein n=1 Tax=uncultured Ilyobacter sp. TaxID=544433 RepID=UPI0029C040D4|nr:hypothetical protein [uncultured Ilyobacter sp.]